LPEERRALGVQAAGEKIQGHVEGILPALRGIKERGHGMVVGDEIQGLAPGLQFNGGPHHAEIISEVQGAAGLNAG